MLVSIHEATYTKYNQCTVVSQFLLIFFVILHVSDYSINYVPKENKMDLMIGLNTIHSLLL